MNRHDCIHCNNVHRHHPIHDYDHYGHYDHCGHCGFSEYGDTVLGGLRNVKPECPYMAVIPTVTVVDKSNIKGLADCFVHVSNINTTYYIDDKHRMLVTWAGPVEESNYDYEENPLGLRGQTVYDFANNRAIYYNKTGAYRLIELSTAPVDDTAEE